MWRVASHHGPAARCGHTSHLAMHLACDASPRKAQVSSVQTRARTLVMLHVHDRVGVTETVRCVAVRFGSPSRRCRDSRVVLLTNSPGPKFVKYEIEIRLPRSGVRGDGVTARVIRKGKNPRRTKMSRLACFDQNLSNRKLGQGCGDADGVTARV